MKFHMGVLKLLRPSCNKVLLSTSLWASMWVSGQSKIQFSSISKFKIQTLQKSCFTALSDFARILTDHFAILINVSFHIWVKGIRTNVTFQFEKRSWYTPRNAKLDVFKMYNVMAGGRMILIISHKAISINLQACINMISPQHGNAARDA